MITSVFLDATEKPDKRSLFTVTDIILLNTSMTIANNEGDKVPLSQAMGTIKEARWSSVNQDKEAHRRDAMSYPFSQSLIEITSSQYVQKEGLINMIVSFL